MKQELKKIKLNGIGIEKDETKAFKSYKQAAEKGDVNSTYQLQLDIVIKKEQGLKKIKLKHLNYINKQLKKIILLRYINLDIFINMEQKLKEMKLKHLNYMKQQLKMVILQYVNLNADINMDINMEQELKEIQHLNYLNYMREK